MSRGLGGGAAAFETRWDGLSRRKWKSTEQSARARRITLGCPQRREEARGWEGVGGSVSLSVGRTSSSSITGDTWGKQLSPTRTWHQKLVGRRATEQSALTGAPPQPCAGTTAPPELGCLWPSLREAPGRQESLSSDRPALPSTHHPIACAWPPSTVESLPFLGADPQAPVIV